MDRINSLPTPFSHLISSLSHLLIASDTLLCKMTNTTIGSASEFQENYLLLEKLGEGGYGSVYMCLERLTANRRAVKSIPDNKVRNRTHVESLNQSLPNEIVLWGPLRHPNIVSLLEVFLDSSSQTWWMVMEFQPGYLDLFHHVDDVGPLSEEDSVGIIRQLLNVVQYLTLHDVDHRDLKDENILYNPTTKHIKLIDFGSSSPLSPAPYTFFRGTDVYIPPEYFNTRKYLPLHASTWAIGCIAFILLDGDSPFQNRDEIKEFKAIEDLNPKYSEHSSRLDFIRCCMDPNPDTRILLSEIADHSWLSGF